MTNEQVKQAFMRGESGRSTNLVSTGEVLLSYGWWEVARWVNGSIILRNGPAYSMTTATKHRSGVLGVRAIAITPSHVGHINV